MYAAYQHCTGSKLFTKFCYLPTRLMAGQLCTQKYMKCEAGLTLCHVSLYEMDRVLLELTSACHWQVLSKVMSPYCVYKHFMHCPTMPSAVLETNKRSCNVAEMVCIRLLCRSAPCLILSKFTIVPLVIV